MPDDHPTVWVRSPAPAVAVGWASVAILLIGGGLLCSPSRPNEAILRALAGALLLTAGWSLARGAYWARGLAIGIGMVGLAWCVSVSVGACIPLPFGGRRSHVAMWDGFWNVFVRTEEWLFCVPVIGPAAVLIGLIGCTASAEWRRPFWRSTKKPDEGGRTPGTLLASVRPDGGPPVISGWSLKIALAYGSVMFVLGWYATQPEFGGLGFVMLGLLLLCATGLAMLIFAALPETRHIAAGLLLGVLLSWPAWQAAYEAKQSSHGQLSRRIIKMITGGK